MSFPTLWAHEQLREESVSHGYQQTLSCAAILCANGQHYQNAPLSWAFSLLLTPVTTLAAGDVFSTPDYYT